MLGSQASRSLEILMPTKKERGFNRETLEKACARFISLPAAYCDFSQKTSTSRPLLVSSDCDQRNSQLHHFTIGFQKPGICADSWFLESNGKMVQSGFSLIRLHAAYAASVEAKCNAENRLVSHGDAECEDSKVRWNKGAVDRYYLASWFYYTHTQRHTHTLPLSLSLLYMCVWSRGTHIS
jgi:hypothetical protein